jgi:hypothetical protein
MARLKLFALWLIVGIPLVWGVTNTVKNAIKLFQ